MKVLALAGLAASASALLAPAAMPRALVARPAPTADATVLEVPRPRLFFARARPLSTLVSVAELVSRHTTSQEGVGFKPQSLRRRGFEPHRMHLIHLTDWRTGGASDSSPYRLWCVAAMAWRRWRGGYAIMPSPRPRRAVERTQIDDENHRVSKSEKRGADGTRTGSSSARSRPTGSTASTSSSAP